MRRVTLLLLFLCSIASATPDGPRWYYLGPKVDPGGDIDWAWPPGAMAGIDLSGATNNIAFYWSDHPISAPGSIYGGTDLARTMGAGAKAIWAASTEVDVPAGSWTLLDLLWGSLNGWDNVSGLNPIVPTSEGFKELWMPGHSLVRKEKWQGEFDDSYNRVRRLVRQSIKRAYLNGLDELAILDSITPREFNQGFSDDDPEENKYIDAAKRLVENRGLTPAEAKQFIQDYIAKKYRQFLWDKAQKLNLDWRDLVAARVPMLGPVKPSTTYTDDFSGTLAAWTTIDGTWGISTGQIYGNGSGSDFPASIKYGSFLSSDDHYSEINFTSYSNSQNWTGCATRVGSSGETFYYSFQRAAGPANQILKCVADSNTSLVGDSTFPGTPFVVRLKSDGSTQTLYHDGSSVLTITDTSIVGNLVCGLVSHHAPSGTPDYTYGDDFVCEDLPVPSTATSNRAVDLFHSSIFHSRLIR